MTVAPERHVTAPTRVAEPSAGHVGVRLALVAGAIAIVVMWWIDPSPMHGAGAAVTAAGRLAGLLGAYLVLVQLLLMARIAWFEHAVGFDRLTAWHRGLGTNTVLLLVAHVLLIVEGYSLTDHRAVVSTGWRVLSTYPSMLKATAGLLLFGLVAVTSGRAMRRRLSYEAWYAVHLTAYAAVSLAFMHQINAGQDFVGHPVNRALWWGLYLFVAIEVLRGRVFLPFRTWFRHRMLVERVVVESPGVVSVWVRGRRLHDLGAEAGQFLLWRFLAPGHVWSAHPYSLSAAPQDGRLRITVKDAGDHSAALAHLRPGTPVIAEGPFGHFTLGRSVGTRLLLVAGGSGIGPIRALAEELVRRGPRHHLDAVLVYRVGHERDLALRHELDLLAREAGLRVFYVVGHRSELGADPFSPAAIHQLVPDVRSRDVYVCGPAGMTHDVLRALRELRVPVRQLHSEDFEMA
ncbi:ferredoxin reductase family protein [Nocardioides jensenii]|uniref:ferredoxin reductase family protein n=1 Tax=Nocardioides jensenii TaxID=1843 RepID=UPI0009E86289|nr:ferredoxin reductase family protein [Nocardioides jensenii]